MSSKERHAITIYPDMVFGEPAIDSHRITAELMAKAWWCGEHTVEGIKENWPGMNRGAVLVACWYMARYGTRLWKKRWGEWLKTAEIKLWHDDYKTCPMPPQEVKE